VVSHFFLIMAPPGGHWGLLVLSRKGDGAHLAFEFPQHIRWFMLRVQQLADLGHR
jgi:hypothetical protein